MMRLFSSKTALFFAILLITLCHFCTAADGAISQTEKPAVKPAAPEQKLSGQPVVKPAAEPTVVASIGDYVITSEELEKKLMMELYPYDYENYSEKAEPARWLTRDYGTFGPRREDARSGKRFTLARGQSILQRVGILVHTGDVKAGKVADRYAAYIRPIGRD